MRIAIDARLWGEPRSGVGRYTRALVEALVRQAPEHDWVLYVDRAAPDWPFAPPARCLPWRQRLVWTFWAASRDLRRHPADLYHGVTGFELPWSATGRLVTTVHDLIPLRFPALVPPRHRWVFRLLLGSALRRASRVIVNSQATRAELLARYRLPGRKVDVVPMGVSRGSGPPSAAARAALRARYGLADPYVLFVGLLEPKKNLPVLLAAVARLVRAGTWGPRQLVLAGAAGWGGVDWAQEAARLGLGEIVRLLGPVPEAELPVLYAEALAFVFPSLYEGFGLPVLEALAAGTPVIASCRGALPEVAGDAALLVDPDANALAGALERLLDDPALQERLRAAGPARAAAYSWERVAAETLAVYHAATR